MAKIERTSAGLRDALFDAIENLREGNIEAQDGKAIASLAAQICHTVELEMAVVRMRQEFPSDAKVIVPAPIPLGVEKPK